LQSILNVHKYKSLIRRTMETTCVYVFMQTDTLTLQCGGRAKLFFSESRITKYVRTILIHAYM